MAAKIQTVWNWCFANIFLCRLIIVSICMLGAVMVPVILQQRYLNAAIIPTPKLKPDTRSVIKIDGQGNKISYVKQRSQCSPRKSKWEHHLAIDCNKDAVNATTPERLLQNLCNSRDKKNIYSSWTSAEFSRVYLRDHEQGVSNTISVSIETFDEENNRKYFGYDLIVIHAEQDKGDGRSTGVVTDFKNGSYLGIVNIFWTGTTSVYTKVVSTIQNTCLRHAAIEKYGTAKYAMHNIRLLCARFGNGIVSEYTECNPNSFVFGSNKLCNFTSLNDDMSWFCGHPKNKSLACSDIKNFEEQNLTLNNSAERTVKPFVVKFRRVRVSSGKSEKTSNINNRTACKMRDPIESWKEPIPTGFWLNGSWNFVRCYSTLNHTFDEYRVCLRNTSLIMLGDSTIRQYANYIRMNIMHLPRRFARYTFGKHGFHRYDIEHNFGINLMFFKHEMPLHFGMLPRRGIVSIPSLMNSFLGNNDVVNTNVILLLGHYIHYSPFPPYVFRERMRKLAVAIERFLEVKPSTKVFFKGPHLTLYDKQWFDARDARLYRLIVEEEFSNILHKVIYLDSWDITVAHGNIDVHPLGNAFESHFQQFMAYIC